MPLTTPAAEVYHATPAVTMPAQPPACSHQDVSPCERLKYPIASRISVIWSVSKTPKTAMLTRTLQRSMYVLKIANATTNQPAAFVRLVPASCAPKVFESAESRITEPSDSQKPP